MQERIRWKKGDKIKIQELDLEVIYEIAGDSMGSVWLLKIVDRNVLLVGKIISPDKIKYKRPGDIDYQSKFVNECRLSLLMPPHPNIATTMSVDLHNNEQYIILMEYIPGIDLYDWFNNRKQELETLRDSSNKTDRQKFWSIVLSISIQIVRGIRLIHKKKIVHRDLKTKNIILKTKISDPLGPSPMDLSPDDIVIKIVDLGLAKMDYSNDKNLENSAAQNQLLTSNDTVGVGTPQYRPPEQFGFINTDESHDLRAVDIFSFGVTLCELISIGQRPFDAIARYSEKILFELNSALISLTELENKYKELSKEFASNSLISCPPELLKIILQATEFFPENRLEEDHADHGIDIYDLHFENIEKALEKVYKDQLKTGLNLKVDNFALSNSYLLYDSRASSLAILGFEQDALTIADKAIELNNTNAYSLVGKYLIFAKL